MSNNSMLVKTKEILCEHLPILSETYHVKKLGVFGSFIHNKQTPDSDLDILVTFTREPGLFKFVELENYLTDLLGIKVDLVMKSALKPRIGKCILEEVIEI